MPEPQTSILLVEDNDGDAELVNEFIGDLGATQFVLTRAKTLAEAIRARLGTPFDVILLDLNLPDSKGLDTLAAFCRSTGLYPLPPIIVLTGLHDEDTADQAMQSCAHDYLVKSEANAKSLLRAIRFAIQRQGKEALSKIVADQRSLLPFELDQPPMVDDESASMTGEQATKVIEETSQSIDVLRRVTKTALGQAETERLPTERSPRQSDVDMELQLGHINVGQQASEVALSGIVHLMTSHAQRLDQMQHALDTLLRQMAAQDREWSAIRVEVATLQGNVRVLTVQLMPMIKLSRGDGSGLPLETRMDRMERDLGTLSGDFPTLDTGRQQVPFVRRGVILGLLLVGFGALLAWAALHYLELRDHSAGSPPYVAPLEPDGSG